MYKLINDLDGIVSIVLRVEDGAQIPFDPDNQDFVQYQKWLSEGNQPLPVDEQNA